ncbi:hypothetical protein JTB14_015665 [Gonioctena quinquepunctata]|nr:hypothetical protein JTB14_015665 [Gonioctena quinquepunctata]
MENTFRNEKEVLDYLREACYGSVGDTIERKKEGTWCSTFFDGYLCWPNTTAGQLAVQPCSGHLLQSTDGKGGQAYMQCTENGTWLELPDAHRPYTNFTECGTFYIASSSPVVDSLYPEWIPRIKAISCVGYSVSMISLVISIFIFVGIKRLRCSRNTLHINLFISFILRSFMSVMKDGLFVQGTALACDTFFDKDGRATFPENVMYSWVCKAIVSVRFYFIIVNFMFMLMEGMYLHNLMFLKLFSDNHSVTIYCLIGWGLPILFIVPWMILRVIYENVRCWTEKKNMFIGLLVDLPICITVVINFILFLVIVRVLTVKLNNAYIQQRKFKYRKLMKATLILIPLFGVPYAFTFLMSLYIMQGKKNPVLEIIWLFFDQSFAAFQGLFAALVYCLLNSEVRIEILRKYSFMKDRHNKEFRRSRTISNTVQIPFTDDDFPDSPETLRELVTTGNPEKIVLKKDQQCFF